MDRDAAASARGLSPETKSLAQGDKPAPANAGDPAATICLPGSRRWRPGAISASRLGL